MKRDNFTLPLPLAVPGELIIDNFDSGVFSDDDIASGDGILKATVYPPKKARRRSRSPLFIQLARSELLSLFEPLNQGRYVHQIPFNPMKSEQESGRRYFEDGQRLQGAANELQLLQRKCFGNIAGNQRPFCVINDQLNSSQKMLDGISFVSFDASKLLSSISVGLTTLPTRDRSGTEDRSDRANRLHPARPFRLGHAGSPPINPQEAVLVRCGHGSVHVEVEFQLHLPNDAGNVRPVAVQVAHAAHRPVAAAEAWILPRDAAVLNVGALASQVEDAVDSLLNQGLELSSRARGLWHRLFQTERSRKRSNREKAKTAEATRDCRPAKCFGAWLVFTFHVLFVHRILGEVAAATGEHSGYQSKNEARHCRLQCASRNCPSQFVQGCNHPCGRAAINQNQRPQNFQANCQYGFESFFLVRFVEFFEVGHPAPPVLFKAPV